MKTLRSLLSTALIITSLSIATAKPTIVSEKLTVCAGGKVIVLDDAKIAYLHSLHIGRIDAALSTHRNIKYNATADLIIALLSK